MFVLFSFLVFDNQRNYIGIREIIATLLLNCQLELLVVLHHVMGLYLGQVNLRGDNTGSGCAIIAHTVRAGVSILITNMGSIT